MHAFAQIPKTTQQATSTTYRKPGQTHFGQSREVNSIRHLQSTIGNQAVQRLLGANTGNGKGDLTTEVARFGHDFGRIPAHTRTSLRPHENTPETLRREANIYSQGKTPVRIGGKLVAWDAKPLSAPETGAHLREIQHQFGSPGVEQSVRGLAQTRGEGFAHSAVEHAGSLPGAGGRDGGTIGSEAACAIRASNASGPLHDSVREQLTNTSGYNFAGISIHNDIEAHRAAHYLNARAFTVGRNIYFARNEYQPTTAAGLRLLAHEAAHVVQQRGHETQLSEHARTTGSADREENEAKHFADFVVGPRTSTPPQLTPSTRTGLVQRAISFTHDNDTFTTNPVTANEDAIGVELSSNPGPSFQWDTDVTIHGVAGDPFGNFEVGFLQVERVFYVNVFWGSGANQTHRSIRPNRLPRRDATAVGNTWYDDGGPSLAPAFTADGDVRSPSFDDTPSSSQFPWDNPIPGRVSTSGWFNYGDAFVTYLSARDTTAGTGARAFRDLANVYWNQSASGSFDTTKPVGSRVTFTSPGNVNHSGVIEGGSAEFPAIHGGAIANGNDITTDT